jgi:prepilin-type N-terminal cleavage/methylation domain-containing protein
MFKSLLARAREIRAAELEGEGGFESGFTLIELMVVLLIIAILLAIAIPTFLTVSGGARDRAAQSNATNALTDLIAYYQNAQNFGPGSATDLATAMGTAEPTFTWVNGANACTTTNASKCVSVQNFDVSSQSDYQAVVISVLSANANNCWFVANLQSGSAAPVTADSAASLTATSGMAFQNNTAATFTQKLGPSSGATNLTNAGTYYSMKSGTSCQANLPITQGTWYWYSTYTAAQSNPD